MWYLGYLGSTQRPGKTFFLSFFLSSYYGLFSLGPSFLDEVSVPHKKESFYFNNKQHGTWQKAHQALWRDCVGIQQKRSLSGLLDKKGPELSFKTQEFFLLCYFECKSFHFSVIHVCPLKTHVRTYVSIDNSLGSTKIVSQCLILWTKKYLGMREMRKVRGDKRNV